MAELPISLTPRTDTTPTGKGTTPTVTPSHAQFAPEAPQLDTDPTGTEPTPVSFDSLGSDQAIIVLGHMACIALRSYGQVTFFINAHGNVEVAPVREVGLDALPEEQALEVLIAAGYNDQKLAVYLQGRDARRTFRR